MFDLTAGVYLISIIIESVLEFGSHVGWTSSLFARKKKQRNQSTAESAFLRG